MGLSRAVRKKRLDYENELLFEGMKVFVRSIHDYTMGQIGSKTWKNEDERDAALVMSMGVIVEDMWTSVVSKGMSFDEYARRARSELEESIKEAMENERRREEEAAEESGYRIV